MNDNIEERINLQKALFEIEDANLFNRWGAAMRPQLCVCAHNFCLGVGTSNARECLCGCVCVCCLFHK